MISIETGLASGKTLGPSEISSIVGRRNAANSVETRQDHTAQEARKDNYTEAKA